MSDKIEVEGKILEALPNAMFKVEIAGGKVILGHISGKMRSGSASLQVFVRNTVPTADFRVK